MRPRLLLALFALLLLTSAAHAADRALVSIKPGAPIPYGGHENHVGKRWLVLLNSEPGSYGLQHWGCYDPSHLPFAPQPEGSIGMTGPGSANWYDNGFFNFSVDDDRSVDYPVKAIRALDSGSRASCEFLWDMPKAWVRVRFMVVPGKQPLFCSLTETPKTATVPKLRARLVAYPSGYFTDGGRVSITPLRTLHSGQKVTLDAAREWSWIFYDERRDLGMMGSGGGAGGITAPDLVAQSTLDTGMYGCTWQLEAKGRELRFAFWGGQDLSNAALVPNLQAKFAPALADLEALDFTPQRLQPQGLADLQAEFDKLFRETSGTDEARKTYETLFARLQQLRGQIGSDQVNLPAEDEYLSALDKLDQLLWKVRMDWVFAD
jgi:hypothetical protein